MRILGSMIGFGIGAFAAQISAAATIYHLDFDITDVALGVYGAEFLSSGDALAGDDLEAFLAQEHYLYDIKGQSGAVSMTVSEDDITCVSSVFCPTTVSGTYANTLSASEITINSLTSGFFAGVFTDGGSTIATEATDISLDIVSFAGDYVMYNDFWTELTVENVSINVTSMPLPAGVWTLGAGLGLLFGGAHLARRRASSTTGV